MLANDDCKDLILREIEILQKLDHPNIVKYYGHFYEDKKFYIVLEYIEGGDLESYLRKNKPPLPEEIVLSFFSQLVSGLSYAHSFKIIHRDLKPANILLTKDDKIKIIDFNSAKMVQTFCSTSDTLAGTPGYVPLEILTREGHSFPADVFSLGCVIYELMTGKPPFYHKDIIELRKMLETQDPPSIEGNYSRILKFIVMEMLKKNPDERITLKEIQSFLLPYEQNSQLQAEKQNLEEQNLQLLNSVNQFQVYSDYLESQNSQLQTEKQNLEREKSEFQAEKLDLERENSQLQAEKQNLEKEKSELSNQNSQLQTEKQNLEREKHNFKQKNKI
jgi:serine/threonine protein kinase